MTQLLEFLADKLPPQDQRNLSFSSRQPKAFREWVDALPVVNVGETAKMLYQAIQELCHLKASAAHRLQLLELIRPKIHYTVDALKQHYAHQPILLSAKSRKIASLCQALQKHLAVGYKVCLISALDGGFLGTAKEHIPTAMHRFLSELVFILLRCYQLYHPAIPMLWYELHLIYALAEERALLDHCLDDSEVDPAQAHSISDLYKKAIILATCKPNQLQANDLENIFFDSNKWSNLALITQDPTQGGLFAVGLTSDAPPGYVKDLKEQHHHIRYIDVRNAIKHLHDHQSHAPRQKGLNKELPASERAYIDADLSQHLITVFSRASNRANERIPQSGPVEAALGMNNCYEHLCTLQDFQPDAHSKQTAETNEDVIDMGAGLTRQMNHNTRERKVERYGCSLINVSARGICLVWNQQLPMQLKNGELVILRHQDKNDWLLGSIQWTRHFHGEGLRTGIQLFAPNMVAVQVKRQNTGSGEWLPSILLPPDEMGARPSLITGKNSFKPGSEVLLQYHGEHCVVLEKITRQSGAFSEYSISTQESLFNAEKSKDAAANGPMDDIGPLDLDDDLDGLWSDL